MQYLLVRALEQAGRYSDIQPVYLPPSDARAAFERHSVDAWVIWDPYQAAAEKQLSARVPVDGRELVDNHQFYSPPGLTRNGIRRCSTSWWTRSARSVIGRGANRSR